MTGVSVVVCSRNRPLSLERTIRAILASTSPPDEIVVVDQSDRPTRPGTADGIRYLLEPGRGASRARNRGAAAARAPTLVFVDDDITMRPGALAALVAPLRSDPSLVTTARVLAPATQAGHFVPSTKEDPDRAEYAGRVGKDVLWTGAMAISRAVFDAVGRFDERFGPGHAFPAAEDNDLGYRLLEAGHTIVYVPEAAVVHEGARPLSDYMPLRWAYGVGMGAFYAKHARPGDPHTVGRLGRDLARHLGRAVGQAPRRSRRQTAGDLVYSVGLLAGAARWWLGSASRRDAASGGS